MCSHTHAHTAGPDITNIVITVGDFAEGSHTFSIIGTDAQSGETASQTATFTGVVLMAIKIHDMLL